MQQRYIEIPTTLLQSGSVSLFNIYLKALDGYMLYAQKDKQIEKGLLDGLSNIYMKSVYIDETDEAIYKAYLRENLSKIAKDKKLDRDQKSRFMYDAVREIIKEFFEGNDLEHSAPKIKEAADIILEDITQDSSAFLSMVKASSYDYCSCSHCINVAIYSIGIGVFLELESDDLRALAYGAALHDIGKKFLNRDILDKTGALSDEEFAHVKQHPSLGYDFLKNVLKESDERVLTSVRHHHEKMDGSGYPDKLSQEQISLHARIIAVADIFDAINTNKPYKDSMGTFDTLMTMKNQMGNHIDTDILKAFMICLCGK